MAANGNSGNGNTSTGQSAASAQAAAAAGNAAASNAANGNTGTGNTSTGQSAANSNAANSNSETGNGNGKDGGSNPGFGVSFDSSTNTFTPNGPTPNGPNFGDTTNAAGLKAPSKDYSKGFVGVDENSIENTNNRFNALKENLNAALNKSLRVFNGWLAEQMYDQANVRSELSPESIAKADKAYTEARARGLTEAEAQKIAKQVAIQMNTEPGEFGSGKFTNAAAYAFKAKNIGPTYNPAETAQANTNKTIAKGSSEMGPSTPAASTAPAAPSNTAGPAAGSTSTETAAPSTNDAANTGITNRGSTVANGGTSVTDSGTGGSISSSINPPSRDASSIGLGVYNTDRANYDQDNWNRGMEAESSSLVSDEECKAFAKRAFLENSEPFKRVRVTIIKKC